jgi:hypothetical protein
MIAVGAAVERGSIKKGWGFAMSIARSLGGWLAAVTFCFGIQMQSLPVMAADMPVKARPLVAPVPEPLDIHGSLDITAATNRVTGAGFLLYPSGAGLVQVNASLAFDIYKSKSGFINSVTRLRRRLE